MLNNFNIYVGTWSNDLGTKVITTGVIFGLGIIPIPLPLFPKYYKQELQNVFTIEGNDLVGIQKLFVDGNNILNPNGLLDKGISKILGTYEQRYYKSSETNNAYTLSKYYKVGNPYGETNTNFFSYYDQSWNYGFFLMDTLSTGTHAIQVEISGGQLSNTFTFNAKTRLTTHIERLELEISRADFASTPFSSLAFTIPADTVKYIYIIAPRNNAAFTRQSSVLFNNYPIPFEYINHGVLRAKVTPEFAYNGGSNSIAVVNPGGYAIPASVQNFTVQINFAEGQPDSKVTSIEPTSLPVANRDTTITIRGIGFTPFVNVLLHHTIPITNTDENGNEVPDWTIEETPLAISNVTPSSMTVTIPARFRNSVTIDTLIIGHLRWGRRADTVFLPIRSIITVSSVQPNILEADIQGEPIQRDTLTIRGNSFDAATTIWSGQEFLTIIERSDTLLRAVASQGLYSSARNLSLTVSNGNTAAQVNISVQYPRPIIDSISPRLIEVPSPALIAINDAKFGSSLTSGDTQDLRPVAGVEEIITEPKLYPNAPNPFDNRTEISYRLPDDGRVKIEVIDRFGAIVATLVNEQKRLGSYNVEWNAQGLPSGTYYARMTVVNSKGKVTQKIQSMTLIR